MNDGFEIFLGVIGSIHEAAVRGYGSREIAMSLYVEPQILADNEPRLNIRLMAMDTPKEMRLYRQAIVDGLLLRQIKTHPNPAEALTSMVEFMGKEMAEAEVSGRTTV